MYTDYEIVCRVGSKGWGEGGELIPLDLTHRPTCPHSNQGNPLCADDTVISNGSRITWIGKLVM